MRITSRWHASFEFACRTASCRPPTSGGTGGSTGSGGSGMSAALFAHVAIGRGQKRQNGWLNVDGSVTTVENHEENDGYTQATLKSKARIIAMPHRSELTVDGSLMSKGLTPAQVSAVHVMVAQTKTRNVYLGGHQGNSAVLRGASRSEVEAALLRLPKVLLSEQRQGD